jgi:hypothetical protein
MPEEAAAGKRMNDAPQAVKMGTRFIGRSRY